MTLMEILLLILLAFSPGILYVLALVVMGFHESLFYGKCPRCGGRSLTMINGVKATLSVDGQRIPDSWTYFLCTRCEAHLKRHRNTWTEVGEEEWSANQIVRRGR